MYLTLGRITESEAAIKRLTELLPMSSEPWYNLAVIQSHRGAMADAVTSLQKALKLNEAEIKQNPAMVDLRQRLYKDAIFAGLRASPEFKAAFPPKP